MIQSNETKKEIIVIYKTVFNFVIFKVKTNFYNRNVIKQKKKLNDYQMEAGIGAQNLKNDIF